MKSSFTQLNQLILWHKGFERHRISRPELAPELLFSLFSATVMMLIYFSWVVLLLHLLVLRSFFGYETISWAIIEANIRWILIWLPDRFLGNQLLVLGIFFGYVALGLVIKRILNAGVAYYHPKGPILEE